MLKLIITNVFKGKKLLQKDVLRGNKLNCFKTMQVLGVLHIY